MINSEHFDNRPQVKNRRLNVLPENPEKIEPVDVVGPGRFPSWLHRKIPKGSVLKATEEIIDNNRLHTVCEEAKCPNLLECWSKKTATFLVMGKSCTRNCGFCSIDFSKTPSPLDQDEPQRVAESVKQLGLHHVVITMVARDDLVDGGADHLYQVIQAIRNLVPEATIEVLTSDFMGRPESLERILEARPEIFNHNIETVRRLTPRVRHTATYERTLDVLKSVKKYASHGETLVKSGMMIGLGESIEEVEETIRDLREAGCEIITIGQYLQPNTQKLRVQSFIHPDQFKHYEDYGHSIGVTYMYCGPFVRSSYNANVVIKNAQQKYKTIQSS